MREGHTIRIAGETYAFGDEIPSSKVDSKTLKKWKEKGWVGSVAKPGVISGRDKLEEQISDLSTANKVIQVERDELKAQVHEHGKETDDLKKAHAAEIKGMQADINKAVDLERKMAEIVEARSKELDEKNQLLETITKLKTDHATELETLKKAHAVEVKELKEKKK